MPEPFSSWRREGARAFLFALLTVGGCTCEDSVGVGSAGQGRLEVQPAVVDFGRVFRGQWAEQRLTVRSTGRLSVDFSSRFVGPAPGFVLVNPQGQLAPGAAVDLSLFYRPSLSGPIEARLEIVPSDPESPLGVVRVLGEGRPVPDCEDGNGCTVDRFDFERESCVHEAARLPCDDFNGCTVNDLCVEGVCLGEGTSCDDNDVCTDDLCDPRQGCVNRLIAECDDNNPCTADSCDPIEGCRNDTLPDGTPCDDFEQCTEGDICVLGRCRGIRVPDLSACDDGNPCSRDDQCIEGECRDPNYRPPQLGDIAFATPVGQLAAGATENPLITPEDAVFVGSSTTVRAFDACGDLVWTASVASSRFAGALLLPGSLSVPVGPEVWDLDPTTGNVLERIDVSAALPPSTNPETLTVRVLDMAARASGALVLSVERALGEEREGFIVELDAPHEVATTFVALGPRVARRVVIDRDESLVLLVRSGAPNESVAPERVVRLGIEGLAGGSWSAGPLEAVRSELALGAAGEVLWSHGLTRISARGEVSTLAPAPALAGLRRRGAALTFGPWTWNLESETGAQGFLRARTSTGAVAVEIPLADIELATTPVIDAQGRIYLLDARGIMRAFDADARPLFETDLELGTPVGTAALALSSRGMVIAVVDGRLFGVQGFTSLAFSSWPKHRRDNFGTGHR